MEAAPKPRSRATVWLVLGLAVWVVALITGIVAVIVTGGGPGHFGSVWDEERVLGDGPKIAMVEISGEIFAGHGAAGLFGAQGQLGSDDYVSQLRQAEEDDGVHAVILRIESPGGSVVASAEIHRAVQHLSRVKPVVALLEDVAASGGYYVAAGANDIVANPSTLTGSIGVIAMFPNLEGTAKKLGVRPVVIKSGRLKDIGSPFRKLTAEERRILQRLIDEAYEEFVNVVSTGRRIPARRVRALADGRIYSGRQALKLGLVDSLGGIDEALDEARGAASINGTVELVRYVPPPLGLGDVLVHGADIGRQIRSAISGASSEFLGRRQGLSYLWLG